jgi:hypothetical protein
VNRNTIGRREFLRRGGMAAAAGAALPLLGSQLEGSPARAGTASPAGPDQLFAAGWFDAADRGYARQLRQDPRMAQSREQRQREIHANPRWNIRSLAGRAHVCSKTSSTSSNGRYWVSSPMCPGAYKPSATVKVPLSTTVARWLDNGTPSSGKTLVGFPALPGVLLPRPAVAANHPNRLTQPSPP